MSTTIDNDTVTITRQSLQLSVTRLLKQLPELITANGDDVPLMVRAATPMLTMLLASEVVQSTIASGEVTDYLWQELMACRE